MGTTFLLFLFGIPAVSLIIYSLLKNKKEPNPNLAKTKLRVFNGLIDLVTFFIIWVVLGSLLAYILARNLYIMPWDVQIIQIISGPPLFLMYFVLMEYFTQRTLGKMITKTKVVSHSGGRAGLIQIFIRTLCRVIPFEYFTYLGSLEGLHDRFSGTIVVSNVNTVFELDHEERVELNED